MKGVEKKARPAKAKVVSIVEDRGLRDVPNMLRAVAAQIEEDAELGIPFPQLAIVGKHPGRDVQIYGFGAGCDPDRMYYLLGLAQRHLEETDAKSRYGDDSG